MKRTTFAKIIMGISTIAIVSTLFAGMKVYAADTSEKIEAVSYEFEKDSKYEITGATANGATVAGALEISGNYKSLGNNNGIYQIDVKEGQVKISYSVDSAILTEDETKWHLIEDSTKQIDGINVAEKIKRGAMIIQTSLDGEKWVTDSIKTNIFSAESTIDNPIYETKDIQLVNGCFYKVIICYEQEIVNGTSKKLFINVDDKSYRKCANVYEFYAINSKENSMSNQNSSPRKELGEKEEMKKDTGYSEKMTISNKDPHYGWNLGTFSVNGYTREVVGADGNSMFLKNAGDKVTLWFKLAKDINNLDGTGKYVIAEDKNGYDQAFEVPKTNFKHGALIIRYTDFEGVKHDPVIYTDFLAANATTGADTQAVLFEEGDYEVALDYSIEDTKIMGTETDYRIAFKFSIRNGNTMFFPFDLGTGAELRDNAVTTDGFTIDMAKSRYLNIDVERSVLVENSTGHTKDVRFNRPAKDGDKYTEEGIYVVNVTNQYTNEHTTKTFYVSNDPFIIALSKSGMDIKGLDDLLNQGYTISEDGSLIAPPEPEPIVEEVEETIDEIEEASETEINTEINEDKQVEVTETKVSEANNSIAEDNSSTDSANLDENIDENTGEASAKETKLPIVPISIIVVLLVVIVFMMKNNQKKKTPSINVDIDDESGESK